MVVFDRLIVRCLEEEPKRPYVGAECCDGAAQPGSHRCRARRREDALARSSKELDPATDMQEG